MTNQGWECPRCSRVNAPWMPHCGCHIKKSYAQMQHEGSEKRIIETCDHEWRTTHNPVNKLEKFCVKCGVNARDVPIAGGWL